jgi:hypothetical protein
MTSAQGPNLESLSYGSRGINPRSGSGGAKLGESTLFHASLGAEVGYDSNVFYSKDAKSAGVARVTPAVDISNAERDGSLPDGVYYDLAASLAYREYLTGDESIRSQRAFSPTVGGVLQFSSKQTFSLTLSDSFTRAQDPPYSPGAAVITHDRNLAALQLKFAPGGGRIQLVLRYQNTLDIFETEAYKPANNMGNEGIVDLSWRWLPKTAFFLQVAQGMVTYLESGSTKKSSYPFKAMAGLRGLLTAKLGLNLAAGYTNGFYASGAANTSGLGNLALVAEIIYNMSITSKAGLGYRHDFRDSPFVGDFYNVDAVYAALQEFVGGRVSLGAYGRFENRRFQSAQALNRTDNYVIAGLTADYIIRRMFYVGVGYSLTLNTTSSGQAANAGGIDYTKHLIVGRLGVVY